MDDKLTVREACRRRIWLNGTDAQALEHALTIAKRERDEAQARIAELEERSIDALVMRVGEWSAVNFGSNEDGRTSLHCTLGAAEEVGELCHAILKRDQGIRGTHEEHCEAAQDAIADTIIYLMDLCYREGWDLSSILPRVVGEVTKRDWRGDPARGGTGTLSQQQIKREED